MQSPDLASLLRHFEEKINHVQELLPWARTCDLLLQQADRQSHADTPLPQPLPAQLPDLRHLSDLVLDMTDSLNEIDCHMDAERKRLQRQKVRIQNLLK